MLWSEQNGFFVRALDLDAVGFNRGIVLEGLVDDSAIKGAQRLQFDDISPATQTFSRPPGLS